MKNTLSILNPHLSNPITIMPMMRTIPATSVAPAATPAIMPAIDLVGSNLNDEKKKNFTQSTTIDDSNLSTKATIPSSQGPLASTKASSEVSTKSPGDAVEMITPTQQMISSTIGALATSVIVTPLDVVKIRLQAQQKNFYKNKCFLYCNGLMEHLCYCVNGNGTGHMHAPDGSTIKVDPRFIKWYKRPLPGHFNGTFDALVKISRSEGLASLWSGLPPTLLMAIPATVVYFTAYDRLRVSLWSWYGSNDQPIWIPVLCGAAARCIAATTISPLEMVRTKMQSERLSYWEVSLAIRQLVKYGGLISLWRGLAPTLLRDVPFSSIYWASYEFMKQKLDQRQPTLQFSLAAGAISGSIAAVTTLPFDVAKTHRQIELGERDLIEPAKKKTPDTHSTLKLLKKIHRQNGVAGLFAGIIPRVIKVAPSCAIMISCYECGKQFFVKYNEDKSRMST